MALAPNSVYQEDCIEGLRRIEPGSIDLAFADPPFNIGYQYDVYHDSRSSGEYLDWTRQWMSGVWHALKANGTFWLAIGDEYAAELKVTAQQDIGFTCRSWVIWYYTFGVNCKCGFSRSHTHLFHFVKNPQDFTFNADNPTIRVQSARQLVYADGRANPFGRLPDNTWIPRRKMFSMVFEQRMTPGTSRGLLGRSRSDRASTAVKCPSNSSGASSAVAQTPWKSLWIPSAAVGQHLPSRRNLAANGLALRSPRTTSKRFDCG